MKNCINLFRKENWPYGGGNQELNFEGLCARDSNETYDDFISEEGKTLTVEKSPSPYSAVKYNPEELSRSPKKRDSSEFDTLGRLLI